MPHSAPVWMQSTSWKGFFLGKVMVPFWAVEMRIATNILQLRGKKQEPKKWQQWPSFVVKGLKIFADKCVTENKKGWWMVCHLTWGTQPCRGDTFGVILGQCTPMSLRGTLGLTDHLHGIAVPDSPLPTYLGIPTVPNNIWSMLGWELRCIIREAEPGPCFERWHFERCSLPPALGMPLHQFRLRRAGEAVHRPPWLSWGLSSTALSGIKADITWVPTCPKRYLWDLCNETFITSAKIWRWEMQDIIPKHYYGDYVAKPEMI